MQLIGFAVKKVVAEKFPQFKLGPINTNIEFTNVEEEKAELLKDEAALKISFKFTITYSDSDDKDAQKLGELLFEGDMIFATKDEEVKDLTKAWKKNEIPDKYRLPLINFVLKRCSTKALLLEEDLNLPPHIPFPQIRKGPAKKE